MDKNDRRQPWTGKLASAFGGARPVSLPAAVNGESHLPTLLGSPVVDNLQGSYKGLYNVLETLSTELGIDEEATDADNTASSVSGSNKGGRSASKGKGGSAKKSGSKKGASPQKAKKGAGGTHAAGTNKDVLDDSAMQDNEQCWIQCEACEKWRKLPW